ncbi:hypothetical protein TNCV_943561 [Trichonephila clavipes]|nr:hypothetical protein TNCV_943561 [Trichonephila clavipes]
MDSKLNDSPKKPIHLCRCTTTRDDRHIVRMAVMDDFSADASLFNFHTIPIQCSWLFNCLNQFPGLAFQSSGASTTTCMTFWLRCKEPLISLQKECFAN